MGETLLLIYFFDFWNLAILGQNAVFLIFDGLHWGNAGSKSTNNQINLFSENSSRTQGKKTALENLVFEKMSFKHGTACNTRFWLETDKTSIVKKKLKHLKFGCNMPYMLFIGYTQHIEKAWSKSETVEQPHSLNLVDFTWNYPMAI